MVDAIIVFAVVAVANAFLYPLIMGRRKPNRPGKVDPEFPLSA